MSSAKEQIIKALREATGVKEINLEFPENETFGDYSSNIALLNKDFKVEEIVEKINKLGLPAKAETKVGFINFWLKKDVLIDNLIQIGKEKEKYGSSNAGRGKTVIIDYSSPNIAKPFGIGHLRSTIIGQALYNLYKFLGYKVVGDNHLGDWGTQFGSLLAEIQNSKFKIQNLTIEKMEQMYVSFHKKSESDPKLKEAAREWFKKLEDGDFEAKSIWKKCVDISLEEFERVYNLLGIKIDFAFGESYYEAEMKDLLSNPSIVKHVSEGEDGAKIIDLSKEGINIPLMLLKKDEGTTYATRDLATISFRVRKWNPDIIIYEVGAEQSFYFKQIFAAARLLGLVDEKVKLVHTAHGLYLAPDGKKFATREGKTIKLEDVLDEAIKRASAYAEATARLDRTRQARQVGIGAIKYFDLMHSVASNVVFDWEKMLNLEGNSGPYLQYTTARANSVLRKAEFSIFNFQFSINLQINNEEMAVLRKLCQFQEVIAFAAINYSPNILCNYLYDLAQKFNTFYNRHRIIGSENENFRLALTTAVGSVLKTGLELLGISTPERM